MAASLTHPILIVDDYNTMVRVVRNLLRQLGFTQIDEAGDGAAALTKLRQRPYQLVISDWQMSPMSGGELLQRVRADARLANMPFVMITDNDRGDADRVTARAGWSTCIVKPLTANTLKTKMEAVLGKF